MLESIIVARIVAVRALSRPIRARKEFAATEVKFSDNICMHLWIMMTLSSTEVDSSGLLAIT